jgi:hypothetical protein
MTISTPSRDSTAEHGRLAQATGRAEDDLSESNPWYEWGPYLSERAWGTVREDYSDSGDAWSFFPHDHARSRRTDGMKMVWPGCRMFIMICVLRWRCGMVLIRS